MAYSFVGLHEAGKGIYLYDESQKKVRQVLWGDWLWIDEDYDGPAPIGDWTAVTWKPESPDFRTLFIPTDHLTDFRPLEIIFLDVGQGDGAVLITPEGEPYERVMVIDAGEGDNMHEFLRSRFTSYREDLDFDAAIITHPDQGHYLGFEGIFDDHEIGFGTVYQNGLVERPVSGDWEKVGGKTEDPDNGFDYVENLATSRADIEEHFADEDQLGDYVFPPVMHAALNNPKIGDFAMLSNLHGTVEDGRTYLPGYAPSDERGYTIEVLGPVVESDADGNPRLRRVTGNGYAETKNGHSIILRLHYGDFKILMGGDLNERAEKFLLQHYAGIPDFPETGSAAYDAMIAEASKRFGADVMKACHHGSEKVTDAFLATVNPACFVISSGEDGGHVHPRPDLLGRLGKQGRGDSPVLLSTELQRFTREKEDRELVDELVADIDGLDGEPTAAWKESVRKRIEELGRTNVSVYGTIYVKTDGKRLIAAFKKETDSEKDMWFYFQYVFDAEGRLVREYPED